MRFLQRVIGRISLCAILLALSGCNQTLDGEMEKSLFRVLTVKELASGSAI